MNKEISQDEERLDVVFHALSNRTRRSLLKQMQDGPMMVTELAQNYEMSLNAVSKHLIVLEKAGLIDRSIDGRNHSCQLQSGPLADADMWIEQYRTFWEENLDQFAAYVENLNNVEKK
ncbi:ArsR/SmtB family transcription factor [Lentilitoribacter sp. EG35]|uniref:ArsR/SmtB family transcription factor n=1 Tax=Lentilitoribacter sp. EG35 TaxID=3234192 RepID=UPI0034607151